MEMRLRRIFAGSVCASLLIVLMVAFMVPGWSVLPPLVRYTFPAVLVWSLAVTAYAFYAQLSVSESMKESLKRKTFLDEVTGVYNYRYLDRRLAEETERTRRHGGLTAVLYMDLDGFKQVNDQFGHQVGNIVLEQIAATLSHKMRSCDVFGRIGGDEFLAILPQTDRREAYVLAERLRETVENYSLAVEQGADRGLRAPQRRGGGVPRQRREHGQRHNGCRQRSLRIQGRGRQPGHHGRPVRGHGHGGGQLRGARARQERGLAGIVAGGLGPL